MGRSLLTILVFATVLWLGVFQMALAATTVSPHSMSWYQSSYGFYKPTTAVWGNNWVDVRNYQPAFKQELAYAKQFAPGLGVDPALVLWWTYIETGAPGAKFDAYSYSHCGGLPDSTKYRLDQNCAAVNWGGWQIGYGAQFTDLRDTGLLARAYTAAHGNPGSAINVQKVGQAVLNASKIKKTFPKLTINQLMSGVSTYHKTDANYWAYTLMRDPGISAYILAQEIAWDIAGGKVQGQNYRQVMASWGSYYSKNWQSFSNTLQDIIALWKALDNGQKV